MVKFTFKKSQANIAALILWYLNMLNLAVSEPINWEENFLPNNFVWGGAKSHI